MTKPCINCQREIPQEASFCPHCATSQVEKEEVKVPVIWRKKVILAAAAILLVLLVGWMAGRYHTPQVYEGGAEVVYAVDDAIYHVLVTFSATDGVMKAGQSETTVELPPGMESGFPDQLYIYQEGTDAHVREAFMALVERCTVEAVPLNGAQRMQVVAPTYLEDFPYAAQTAEVIYTTACGTNEIHWTLYMKNGDEIHLQQEIRTIEKNVVSYYPENVPMDTAEDLQALLDQIAGEVAEDTSVEIYLPPVIYDQEIHVGRGSYTFYGGSDGVTHTTFTKTMTVDTDSYQFLEMYGVCFVGEGGTGILARDAVWLIDCYLEGWDVAAVSAHGGWIGSTNSTFANNRVGIQMDTLDSQSSVTSYRNNRFTDNDTAVLISQLYGTMVLTFEETVFAGNGVDIDNPAGHPVDTSGAIFE